MGKMMVNGVSYSGGAENLNELHDVNITSPTAGDVVKWDPTSRKWINGEGGGGNVDDVYVNGVSVLDANKIAQIISYKEVTQAEYDALPASKESDNVLYCIKDKATADTTVAPIIYSEEEREVGVWTDGKPLYQKTYRLASTVVIPSNRWVSLGISGDGIDVIINKEVLDDQNRSTAVQYIAVRDGYINVLSIRETNVQTITIQYTKTTDTPGSGKYAPSGVPAVHYSENEQVVGTWIDGSTVYEKTFSGTTNSTSIYFPNTSDVDSVISMGGYIVDSGGVKFNIPYRDTTDYISLKNDNNGVNLLCANYFVNKDYVVTIRYTKTT